MRDTTANALNAKVTWVKAYRAAHGCSLNEALVAWKVEYLYPHLVKSRVRLTVFGLVAFGYTLAFPATLFALWLCGFDMASGDYVAGLECLLAFLALIWLFEYGTCPAGEGEIG